MAYNTYLLEELTKRDIKVIDDKVKLNDVLNNLLGIKTIDKYRMANISENDIVKILDEEFISLDKCFNMLKNTNKSIGKQLLKNIINKIPFDINKNGMYINNIDNHLITIICINKEIYFKSKDICIFLGYKDTKNVIRKNKNKKTFGQLKGLIDIDFCEDDKCVYINSDGIKELLLKSKKTSAIELCKKFNIKIDTKYLYKEQEVLWNMKRYLDKLNYEYIDQYKIGKYLIDMYIPKLKIAIEIDEHNHSNRDKLYEINRQKYIEKELNCSFLRINPDDLKFNIIDSIGDLAKIIFNIEYKEINKNLLIEIEKTKQKQLKIKLQEIKFLQKTR